MREAYSSSLILLQCMGEAQEKRAGKLFRWIVWLGWFRCGLSWAQQPFSVWSFQQWGVGLDKRDHWQAILITQPRFSSKGWETILYMGKVGYRFHRHHMVFFGGQWVEFYEPRRITQRRLFQRWQWKPSKHYAFTLTIEERWQNGHMWEGLVRPLSRVGWSAGPLWLSAANEIFLSVWTPQTRCRFYPRQHRLWLAAAYPLNKSWQVEVGYLNIFIPRIAPRHRLWIATRIYLPPSGEKQATSEKKAALLLPWQTEYLL